MIPRQFHALILMSCRQVMSMIAKNRIWTPQSSIALSSCKSILGNERPFLGGSAPPPTKTHELGGETVIRLESHDNTSDLQNPDAAELEIPLDDQKSSLDLSEEDPVTIRALHKLASSYYKKGEHQKAMQVNYQKALQLDKQLKAQKRVLGDKHPDTLRTKRKLTWVYSIFATFSDLQNAVDRYKQRRKA